MKRKTKIFSTGLFVCLMASFLFFFIWSQKTYEPSNELYMLVNKEDIKYEQDWIIFEPTGSIKAGIVLYPGAKVEPEAYSYYGKQLANQGYLVAIPHVNFNFAIFDPNKAQQIIETYTSVEKWIISGHSLGGVIASEFAYKHPGEIDGVILLGSYPNSGSDFSKTKIPMLSIYAEKDGLTTKSKIQETKNLLSGNTTMNEIKGGNHGQFGVYGNQKGDNTASISIKEQQDEMVAITSEWLKKATSNDF